MEKTMTADEFLNDYMLKNGWRKEDLTNQDVRNGVKASFGFHKAVAEMELSKAYERAVKVFKDAGLTFAEISNALGKSINKN